MLITKGLNDRMRGGSAPTGIAFQQQQTALAIPSHLRVQLQSDANDGLGISAVQAAKGKRFGRFRSGVEL
jgi:hypothetical protein